MKKSCSSKKIKGYISISVIMGTIRGLLALGIAALINLASDLIIGSSAMEWRDFALAAIVYYCVYMLIYRISRKTQLTAVKKIRIFLKDKLFQGLLWEKEDSHRARNEGDILAGFQYQVDILEQSYYTALMNFIQDVIVFAVAFAAVSFYKIYLALGMLCVLALYLLFSRKLNHLIEKLQNRQVAAYEAISNETTCMVDSYFTARDYKKQDYFAERYEKRAAQEADISFQFNYAYIVLDSITQNLEPLFTLFVIFAGGCMMNAGWAGISAGGILAVSQLMADMMGPVSRFGATFAKIRATREIRQTVDKCETAGMEGKEEWTTDTVLEPFEKIVFDKISFSYEEKQILEKADFSFEKGKKYAIVGPSGEGKTTVLKLLLQQLQPQAGAIYWNDTPYTSIKPGTLLKNISYVGQETVIFHKTILDNIRMGKEEGVNLESVLKTSGVGELLKGKEKGLQEEIGFEGNNLSGGERQRIALARGIYKDAPILILDEFTSALHGSLATEIEKSLMSLPEKTIIHVTHKLPENWNKLYDTVYKLENRKVEMLCGVEE